MGRTTEMDCPVRPCICLARCPTAQPPETTRRVPSSTATTEGSLTTRPSPFTLTSVLAVPRSMARSEPSNPSSRRSILAQWFEIESGTRAGPLQNRFGFEVVSAQFAVQGQAANQDGHERQNQKHGGDVGL